MGKPHKHAEVIKAWADGKTVQVLFEGTWVDCNSPDGNDHYPFHRSREYRIKPEPKVIRYRRYLWKLPKGEYGVACSAFDYPENDGDFVRWIDTEWQEVTIEEE